MFERVFSRRDKSESTEKPIEPFVVAVVVEGEIFEVFPNRAFKGDQADLIDKVLYAGLRRISKWGYSFRSVTAVSDEYGVTDRLLVTVERK